VHRSMPTTFSLQRRAFYPWLFLILCVFTNAGVFLLHIVEPSVGLFLTVTGAVAGLVHFLYAQHNQDTDRFIKLFQGFNIRYDILNGQLNNLLLRRGDLLLSDEDKLVLFDYFNLCAEEYLFFKAGYLDKVVWSAWLKGMSFFAKNANVRILWEAEIELGSYYGFTLKLIDDVV
jgi:hypothetical protein